MFQVSVPLIEKDDITDIIYVTHSSLNIDELVARQLVHQQDGVQGAEPSSHSAFVAVAE
jgi:hypothetical protein